MNWIKLKQHDDYTHRVYGRDGVVKKEVTIPGYVKKTQLHMPIERATKKRRYRINKHGRKVYIEGLVSGYFNTPVTVEA